jgi:hypothetical protein
MKNLESIIANAQSLMLNEDFWAKVDSVDQSRSNGKKTKGSGSDIFKDDLSNIHSLLENKPVQRQKTGNPVMDSFVDKPPMTGVNNPYQLNETFVQTPVRQTSQAPISQPTNTQIDYNYIKYMIEEAVKNALSQNMLNESTKNNFVGMKMCEGNKIQFMDSKGNIYEGVLKLKRKKQ